MSQVWYQHRLLGSSHCTALLMYYLFHYVSVIHVSLRLGLTSLQFPIYYMVQNTNLTSDRISRVSHLSGEL